MPRIICNLHTRCCHPSLLTARFSRRIFFVLGDVSAPNGKRIVALSSELCLAVLNQLHSTAFIDGTFKTAPKYFKQIWILRGHVGDHTCVPLVYFLIEHKSNSSYKEALKIAITHCPEFGSATFMVDFEKSEHIAIRTHLPNSVIKGCLFGNSAS